MNVEARLLLSGKSDPTIMVAPRSPEGEFPNEEDASAKPCGPCKLATAQFDCLSITNSNCLHLIAMAEIIQVPCCKANFIIPTVLHFHNIHYLVFADPRNMHRHNISFLLIADSSM
jgi:hypothetical protein